MTIVNNTSENLYIRGRFVEPNQTIEVREQAFTYVDIHSNIGSCVIYTGDELGKRKYRTFGKLELIVDKDVITVSSAD